MNYTYFGGMVGDFGLTMIVFFGGMGIVVLFLLLEDFLRNKRKKDKE